MVKLRRTAFPRVSIDTVSKLNNEVDLLFLLLRPVGDPPLAQRIGQGFHPAAVFIVRRRLCEENVIRPPEEVLAGVFQGGLALAHLIPRTPEGVVHEELHHIARGEELVADGELPAVARGLGGIAHGLALFLGIEILVDPADGLVFRPEHCQVAMVDLGQELQEGGLPGEESAHGGIAVEEDGEIEGELVEDTEEIATVGVARFPEGGPGKALVKLEALGLIALGDGFEEESPGLGHAEGAEAVENGEGLLADETVEGGLGVALGHVGQHVLQDFPEEAGGLPAPGVQGGELVEIGDGARLGVQAVFMLELAREIGAQEVPGGVDKLLEAVACGVIEGHGVLLLEPKGDFDIAGDSELVLQDLELLDEGLEALGVV